MYIDQTNKKIGMKRKNSRKRRKAKEKMKEWNRKGCLCFVRAGLNIKKFSKWNESIKKVQNMG